MSSSPKSKSESESLHLLEESNSDPKVNNDNVAKKTTLLVQCEVLRRRSPRLSPSPSPSQGFRRSPRLSSDGGKSEKPPPPPPRRRSSTSTSTSRFASPPQNARSTDHFKSKKPQGLSLTLNANAEEEEVVLKVDSTSNTSISIPSSGKFNLDEATSLSEDENENGKKECSFVDSSEKRCSKRFKATASLEQKRKKDKNMSSFIGDPIPDDEAQEKWRWRYEMKVHWKGYSASEDTWEPVEALSNCQERMRDFIRNGLKLKILPLPGDVDVICGGPPCQGITGYNRFRNIDSPLADDRNRQIVVFMDIVEFLKPKIVLMENVIDILRFDKASLGRYALSRLVHMNYQARLGTIAVGCFGLLQFRLRVFLLGAHTSEGKKGIDGLVEKLKIVMISANSVRNDAEEKQFTDSNVKQWLDELKDAVYVADDLLDEIATEALRSESEAEFQTFISKVWGFFPTFANSFDKKIKSEMVKILDRLDLIIKQKDFLGLVSSVALKDAPGLKVVQSRPLTTSHPEVYGVFGRDEEKEAIFEKFQSNGASDDGICVVPIVGMGGVGKTTLARLIYNDKRIEERFDNKVWVCVSENFDRDRILKTISEAIPNDQNMNSPQNELREKYTGKKIFLVLDDIWNEDYCDWVELIKDFRHGAKEIKIIVTTRSEKVALKARTVEAFSLKQLSDNECWSLFEKHAFIDGKASEFPILEDIGKKIVQKCKGLPLAAKALGGLLRCEQDPKEWTKILKNDIWNSPEGQLILPALRLSYHYLPSHLKRCFAYCSIFPKDYEFKKEEVVLLWMAQDFLQQYKGNGRMEEIGEGYFDDLVSRSLFQRSSNNESYFIMHDLVNDLAKFISGEFCFRLEKDDKLNKITKKTRHFFYPEGKFDDSKKFEILYVAKGLRTFLGGKEFPYFWQINKNVEKIMIDDLLEEFKTLRVLSLSSMRIRELPDSIDNLKHLRYLNILCTEIHHLPNSLCNLYSLQTLILSMFITKLPTNTSKLVNLRHLDNSAAKMEEMPPQMGKLKNLRKLPYFVVEKHDDGSSIRELGELQHLSGKLSLLSLENVQCINKDTTEIILKNKQDLSELNLEWKHYYRAEDSEKEIILLEQLCPHTNLNSLTITNYKGTKFPKWLGDSSYSRMVSIKLSNCENCYSLPPLGQLPHLKNLEIECFGKILEVGLEFYGNMINPFRALECLSFRTMRVWQQWVLFKGEVFTCLRELDIKDCPKLTGGLPVQLPSLTKIIGGRVSQHIERVQYPPALHGKSVNIEGGVNSIWPVLSEFTSVTHLNLFSCPDLVSFPSGSGRLCAPNLSQIVIQDCINLESLPEGMHTLLPSLVRLVLLHCPELNSFPEGGLPSSLESLHICKCNRLFSSRMQWGLQDLHSLRSFKIFVGKNQEKLESFPEDALLPPNLTDLYISISNLESLNGKGFQHLTSLKHLKIWRCYLLDCLLEEVLPTSLCELEIYDCFWLIERYGNKKRGFPRISIHRPPPHLLQPFDCFCYKMS